MPYVVFGTPSHEEYLDNCFALVKAYPNYKTLGILDSVAGGGSQSAAWEVIRKALDAAGIRYHNEYFAVGTTDFAPYITRFKEAGCGVVFVAGWVGEFMLFSKQRWEMGYKDMKVACSGPFVDIRMYKAVVGADAAQGLIAAYYDNSQFKETKVNPKYIAQCQEALRIAAEKTGKPYAYTGEIAWLPSHVLILVQAMQKAGTVDDPDAIMKAIRGGTFDTTIGKWTMSGEKTYGSAVVFGTPGALCTIQGDKEVYLSEHPMEPIP
jgi:ABC-type branched-subunit amino acid transport system substrate-binding protein